MERQGKFRGVLLICCRGFSRLARPEVAIHPPGPAAIVSAPRNDAHRGRLHIPLDALALWAIPQIRTVPSLLADNN